MGINWTKLYELSNENNKISGSKFEKLVLDYLNQYYKEYDWKSTKSSWDNNRDFISLILENIWAEAKYKKDCTALKKSDIDPTMMSGFLNGKIEIIFFLTNGYLPDTLLKRIKQAERMHFFRVICITKVQLEYWLYLHPDIYETHFQEKLDSANQYLSAALITEIEILDLVNSNNNLLALKQELYAQHFYAFVVTIEANISAEIAILDDTYPFSFINSPGYENYECIRIKPGIQQFKFLVYTKNCYDGAVELRYKMNDEMPLSYAFTLNICSDNEVKLMYSQQLVYKERIIRILSDKNPNERLLILGGDSGFGKTFLLRDVMRHFYATRQIMYFNFYPQGDYRNAIEMCRLIIYINFGEVVNYFKKETSTDTKDYYKGLLKERLDPKNGDLNLILEIIDGCYDEIHAQNVKRNIMSNRQFINKVILHRTDSVAHLALLDNTERLCTPEYDAVKSIIEHSIRFNSTRFLISSKGRENDCDFYLSGLTSGDIKNSLSNNFTNWTSSFIDVIYKEMPCCPASFIDVVEVLKYYLDQEDNIDVIAKYIHLSDNAGNITLYKSNFTFDKRYLETLSFIYLFENGVPREILYDIGVLEEQLDNLKKAQYIKYSAGNVNAYSKLYRNAFLKENLHICTDYIVCCLNKIVDNATNYENLIFLPEIYTKYIEVTPKSVINISTDLLEHMRTCSYVCDYRNMYNYGKIAYYFLNQKEAVEWSESDYMILFYYGISLLHCDRKRGAIEIFRKIKNSTPIGSNVNSMASCELYNNLYSLFQIDQLEGEILITLTELERKINCLKDETDYLALDIRIAYSTCMNRYMMILFMQDRILDATGIFERYIKYNNNIPISLYSYKYNSMIGEWLLDYARGISYVCPLCAEIYYKRSIKLLENGKNEKRYILAKMDFAFLQCVYFEKFDEIETIHNLTIDLQRENYINEYFRGFLRENLCKLVQYFKNPGIANSKGIKAIAQKMKEEALSIELDSMLYISGRLAYQTGMYFSALDTIIQDFVEAKKYLERNLNMVSKAGGSFTNIALHNLRYYKQIQNIEWGNMEGGYSPHSFILDPRIW